MGASPSPFQADVRLDAREPWPGTGSYTDKERPDATTCPSQPGRARCNGPGGEGVFADTDHDILDYHYYADNGAPLLGINWLGYDSAGWPYVY